MAVPAASLGGPATQPGLRFHHFSLGFGVFHRFVSPEHKVHGDRGVEMVPAPPAPIRDPIPIPIPVPIPVPM